MMQLDFMVLFPLILAPVCVLLGRRLPYAPRWVALSAVLAQIAMVVSLSSEGIMSGVRILGWNGSSTGGVWQLVIDGLSLPLVLLTIFIGLVTVVVSWNVEERPGAYFALILALQAAVSAVFLSESLLLFYVAWEFGLIPMYFLIGGWGSSMRKHAATKFLIYTFGAGGVMLVGVIFAVVGSGGETSIARIAALGGDISMPVAVFWLLMAGFLVKMPAVPFHTWLPDAHTEAPTAGSIVLAGVMLKMGGYGILRIAMPFAPAAFDSARGLLAVLGVIGIVYGAAMALVQTDLKRLVAYSSVSHMGFVLLAIAAATKASLGAAMLGMVSHGFVAGLLFLLVGAVYERTHTRELGRLGGLGRVMPGWSVALVFGALASLGLPGLSGFPGELLAILEAYGRFGWWIAIATLGLVLAAAYNLRAVRGAVQGPVGEFDAVCDLSVREVALVSAFSLGIVVLGMQPVLLLRPMELALNALTTLLIGGV